MEDRFFQEEEQKEERSFQYPMKEDSNSPNRSPRSLSKDERLKSYKAIRKLFSERKRIKDFPLVLVYNLQKDSIDSVKVAFSVPKRLHKNAVDRNLIKRRLRESYRNAKNEFIRSLEGKSLNMMFIYNSSDTIQYKSLDKKLISCLHRLLVTIDEEN